MGSSPTTHIFKNGVIGFKLEALNEFVCMKSAQRTGIATANVEYRMFEDEPALIVERYDRVKVEDGTIRRLHQEDLCQALGVMPAQKYTADGGPTTRDIQELLVNTSHHQLNLYLLYADTVLQRHYRRTGCACEKLFPAPWKRRRSHDGSNVRCRVGFGI